MIIVASVWRGPYSGLYTRSREEAEERGGREEERGEGDGKKREGDEGMEEEQGGAAGGG